MKHSSKSQLELIVLLKNHLDAFTDDALAKKLRVSPSAVAQWYNRGIPQRFLIQYSHIINKSDSTKSKSDSTKSKDEQIISLQKEVIKLQQEIIRLQNE
jgi:hypothetical protein